MNPWFKALHPLVDQAKKYINYSSEWRSNAFQMNFLSYNQKLYSKNTRETKQLHGQWQSTFFPQLLLQHAVKKMHAWLSFFITKNKVNFFK